MNLMYELVAIPIFTYVFHLLDRVITRYGYQRPYYAVHVIHNMGIVGLTVFDLHRSFAHLYTATEYPVNWWAIYLCVALHAYHIIDYLPSLRFDDWLHHGLMIGVAIPLGLNAPSGALFGANLFFTTGLPGLISYSLLFAERNGLLAKSRVQTLNKWTHLWIRAPGCVAQAALVTAVSLSTPDVPLEQQMIGCSIALLTAWNGLYFMEQALSSVATNPSSSNSVATFDSTSFIPSSSNSVATFVSTSFIPSSSNSVATFVSTPFIHRQPGEQGHGNRDGPSPSHSARMEPLLSLL